MRTFAFAVLLTLLAPGTAQSRLFWQTYGATVPAAEGCHWNANQDYFVPRYCKSGRYGLFSACKHHYGVSAACKNLHPFYRGYCTPYGACRYRWRNHVYATHCGCTPLPGGSNPWHFESCNKHSHEFTGGNVCRAAAPWAFGGSAVVGEPAGLWYCNVEPFGGETLGSIAAIAGGTSAVMPNPPVPTGTVQPTPPKLNLTPIPAATSGGLPAPFNF